MSRMCPPLDIPRAGAMLASYSTVIPVWPQALSACRHTLSDHPSSWRIPAEAALRFAIHRTRKWFGIRPGGRVHQIFTALDRVLRLFCFTTTGARIVMPFSPFLTERPRSCQVWKPATCVAVGTLRVDQKNISPAVAVEPSHRAPGSSSTSRFCRLPVPRRAG